MQSFEKPLAFIEAEVETKRQNLTWLLHQAEHEVEELVPGRINSDEQALTQSEEAVKRIEDYIKSSALEETNDPTCQILVGLIKEKVRRARGALHLERYLIATKKAEQNDDKAEAARLTSQFEAEHRQFDPTEEERNMRLEPEGFYKKG